MEHCSQPPSVHKATEIQFSFFFGRVKLIVPSADGQLLIFVWIWLPEVHRSFVLYEQKPKQIHLLCG